MKLNTGPDDSHVPNTTIAEPQYSIYPHIGLYLVQILALASPPFQNRRTIFNAILIPLAVYALSHPYFTKDMAVAQPFNIGWSFYLATLAKLNFDDPPERHYWRIDRPAKEVTSYSPFGLEKLKWSASLMLNTRGIRWNHQVKNVPVVRPTTKTRFLILNAYRFIKNLILVDLCFQLGIRLIWTSPDGQIGQFNSKYMSLRHDDWRWSFLRCLVFGATPYFMMSMQYAQFAFGAVLLNISKPEVRCYYSFWLCTY
jgi:hypothetical protein